jgi:two-component system, chemotaxis family, chemotaxis protein CheY
MAFNILIVDDSEIIRSMIARTIGMTGVPIGGIYEAGNGRDALDVMDKNWIDLVLADLNMPVMDGAAMIETMRGDNILSRIPVVIVSAEGSETKKDNLLRHGVKGFVHKPFAPETIRGVIKNVLGDWGESTGNAETENF